MRPLTRASCITQAVALISALLAVSATGHPTVLYPVGFAAGGLFAFVGPLSGAEDAEGLRYRICGIVVAAFYALLAVLHFELLASATAFLVGAANVAVFLAAAHFLIKKDCARWYETLMLLPFVPLFAAAILFPYRAWHWFGDKMADHAGW